ncbi:NTP pyrophosphohydrolase [Leucobacter chromiiresistens]
MSAGRDGAIEPTDTRPPGRVQVHERVIGKIVTQASAHAIGVARGDVHAEVAEWGGGIAVRLSTRLPIPDLADTEAIRAHTPVFERMRALQTTLAHDLERMTGREIRRISVTVNGAVTTERKRVR